MLKKLVIVSSAIILALITSANASDLSSKKALQLREQGRILSLENLLDVIEKRHPKSNLLEVELEEDDGMYLYEVDLVTANGVVRELEINATTGAILQDEEDD